MAIVDEYRARFKTIVKDNVKNDQSGLEFQWNSVAEARQQLGQIRQMQKEIRLLKKDVRTTMVQIRSSFTAKKSNAQAGFLASMAGKKAAGSDRASKRENLRQQQHSYLAPYEYLNRLIDDALVKLDAVKIRIQQSIDQNSTTTHQTVKQTQEVPSNIRCDKCGRDNPPDYRFCGGCGKPLFNPAQPAR